MVATSASTTTLGGIGRSQICWMSVIFGVSIEKYCTGSANVVRRIAIGRGNLRKSRMERLSDGRIVSLSCIGMFISAMGGCRMLSAGCYGR